MNTPEQPSNYVNLILGGKIWLKNVTADVQPEIEKLGAEGSAIKGVYPPSEKTLAEYAA